MNPKQWLAVIAIAAVIGIALVADAGFSTRYFWFIYLLPGGDKAGHFGLMGALSFIVTLALPGWRWRVGRWSIPLAPLLVLAGVTLEELSQYFIPVRSFDFTDWVADGIGIALGGWLALWGTALLQRRNEDSAPLER